MIKSHKYIYRLIVVFYDGYGGIIAASATANMAATAKVISMAMVAVVVKVTSTANVTVKAIGSAKAMVEVMGVAPMGDVSIGQWVMAAVMETVAAMGCGNNDGDGGCLNNGGSIGCCIG